MTTIWGATAGDRAPSSPSALPWPLRVIALDSSARPLRDAEREFRAHGLQLVTRADATAALREIAHTPAAAVLVPTDLIGMPVVDFTDVVVSLASAPVIIGLVDDEHRGTAVQALDAGARAIVPAPFGPERIAQELRRAAPLADEELCDEVRCGELVLTVSAHRVRVAGTEVHMSPKEFAVLEYLMRQSPRAVRIDELVHVFGGDDAAHVSRLRVLIAKIRSRLTEASPGGRDVLRTIRGIGYRIGD